MCSCYLIFVLNRKLNSLNLFNGHFLFSCFYWRVILFLGEHVFKNCRTDILSANKQNYGIFEIDKIFYLKFQCQCHMKQQERLKKKKLKMPNLFRGSSKNYFVTIFLYL